MEGDLRQAESPPPMDLGTTAGCRRREIRMSSGSSELTVNNLTDVFEHHDVESPVLPVAETTSTEWTDEKHSLYLNSMEASFVNQLYHSTDLPGWRSRENRPNPSCRRRHGNTHISSGQFKVLRDGCWRKINYERTQSQQGLVDESVALVENPWFQHFRAAGINLNVMSPDTQERTIHSRGNNTSSCGLATSSKRPHAFHSHFVQQDSVESNAEVSDQNFVNKDHEGEKLRSVCSGAKRMKTTVADSSSKDQVVPLVKSRIIADPTENYASSEAEHDSGDLQSKNMQGSV